MRHAAFAAVVVMTAAAPALAQADVYDPAVTDREFDELDAALEAAPDDAGLLARYDGLIDRAWRAGDLRHAKYGAVQMTRLRPAHLDDRYRLVRVLLQKGDRDEAERVLRQLLEDRPSLEQPVDLLADLLLEQGRHRDALAVDAACLEEHPGRAASLHRRASVLLWDLGDFDGARAEIAAMRTAADAARSERLAAWLRGEADRLEEFVTQQAADRERLRAAVDRVQTFTWATSVGWLLLLACGWWWTRETD